MSHSIDPPTTYAQWCELFALLAQKTNDQQVCQALKNGVFIWEKDTHKRFMQKLLDAINSRFKVALNILQSDLSKTLGQEIALTQVLSSFRKEIILLYDVLDLPVIPKKDREQYRSLFWGQVDQVQAILDEMGSVDRSGKLAKFFIDNAVNKTL